MANVDVLCTDAGERVNLLSRVGSVSIPRPRVRGSSRDGFVPVKSFLPDFIPDCLAKT